MPKEDFTVHSNIFLYVYVTFNQWILIVHMGFTTFRKIRVGFRLPEIAKEDPDYEK